MCIRDRHDILGGHHGGPGSLDPLLMPGPIGAKHVHGLAGSMGKVQVTQSKNTHDLHLRTVCKRPSGVLPLFVIGEGIFLLLVLVVHIAAQLPVDLLQLPLGDLVIAAQGHFHIIHIHLIQIHF